MPTAFALQRLLHGSSAPGSTTCTFDIFFKNHLTSRLEQLGWKRTTTYTIIKRLGERGILKNENGLVTALVSKDEAQACEIDELVEKKFEGSLPTFIAAFTKRQDLSAHELDEVQQMIDRIRRGETQ